MKEETRKLINDAIAEDGFIKHNNINVELEQKEILWNF